MRPKSVNADPQEGKIAHEDLRRVRAFVLFMEEMGTIPGSCPELSQQEIEDAFAEGGTVENIVPSRFEVRPDPKDISFSDGEPKAWFVVVRRAG